MLKQCQICRLKNMHTCTRRYIQELFSSMVLINSKLETTSINSRLNEETVVYTMKDYSSEINELYSHISTWIKLICNLMVSVSQQPKIGHVRVTFIAFWTVPFKVDLIHIYKYNSLMRWLNGPGEMQSLQLREVQTGYERRLLGDKELTFIPTCLLNGIPFCSYRTKADLHPIQEPHILTQGLV